MSFTNKPNITKNHDGHQQVKDEKFKSFASLTQWPSYKTLIRTLADIMMQQRHNEEHFWKVLPIKSSISGQHVATSSWKVLLLLLPIVLYMFIHVAPLHHHQHEHQLGILFVSAEEPTFSSSMRNTLLQPTIQPMQTIQPSMQLHLEKYIRKQVCSSSKKSTEESTANNNQPLICMQQQQEEPIQRRSFHPPTLDRSGTLSELVSSSSMTKSDSIQEQPPITSQHETELISPTPLALHSSLDNAETSIISPSRYVFYNTTYYFGYFTISYSVSGGSPVYFGTVATNQLSSMPSSSSFRQISTLTSYYNSEYRLAVGGQASYFVWYNYHSSLSATLQLYTFNYIYKSYSTSYSVSMTRGDIEMFYCYSCVSVPNTRYIISLKSTTGSQQNVSVGYTYDKTRTPEFTAPTLFSTTKVFYINPLVPYPGTPPPVYAYIACLSSNGCSFEITLRMSDDLQDTIIIVIASVLGSLVLCTCLIIVVSLVVCRVRRNKPPTNSLLANGNTSNNNNTTTAHIPMTDMKPPIPVQQQQQPIMVSTIPPIKQPQVIIPQTTTTTPSSTTTTTTQPPPLNTTSGLPYYTTTANPYNTMPNPQQPTTYYVPTQPPLYSTLPTSQYRTQSFVNPQQPPQMMMVGMPPSQPVMYHQSPQMYQTQQQPTLPPQHQQQQPSGGVQGYSHTGTIGAPLPSSSSANLHANTNTTTSTTNTAHSTLNTTTDTATTSSSAFIETYRESDASNNASLKHQTTRSSNAQDSEDDRSLLKGRYRVIEKVGKGTFGDCYLCHDIKRNNQAVAVKSIRVDDNDMEKVIDECSKTLTFKHPRLVEVYELFRAKSLESLCLVMKFYQSDLEKCFKTHGFFSEKVIVELIRQIGDGLDYLHNTKMVLHRDMKPKNIFVDKFDQQSQEIEVVIGDYGEAKEMGDTTNSIRGTIIYMSPECLTGQKYSYPSDIFSTGVSFFQLMTGETFSNIGVASRMLGEAEDQVLNSLREQLSKNQLYHEPLINFVLSMLKKDPQNRPTAVDMKKFHL